jgi:S-disulfanyl-L-cysteine oxidoreductase SoxD
MHKLIQYLQTKESVFLLIISISTVFLMAACDQQEEQNNVQILAESVAARADSAGWPASFGFGHTAAADTINKIDIDVRPDGKGLPPGSGTAVIGRTLYNNKCMACHAASGQPAGRKLAGTALIHNPDSPQVKTIGSYWPYATTIFDYVRRSMPYNAPGSLSNDEVYALTAYLLHANRLLDSTRILDAQSLPLVVMPAKQRFIADDRRGGPEIK